MRGLVAGFTAVLLFAAMFVAVHRGARGREIARRLSEIEDRQEAAEVSRSELRQEIEHLRSRARVERAAERLGLHLPDEDELVILDLRGGSGPSTGGGR